MDNSSAGRRSPEGDSGQGNSFFSGFLLGFLIGAFVVFLLGTKKGKKLLKAISEGGQDNISNILDEANKSVDLDEVVEDEPSLAKASTDAEAMVDKSEQRKEFVRKREFAIKEQTIEKPKVRRFFRGISRRVN